MIFAGDVIIKTAIELGIKDMKENPWLIDDVLGNMTQESTLNRVYGQKEVDAAKEWFLNANIPVVMAHRNDKGQFPCVVISLGSSSEDPDMKTNADLSSEVETLMPGNIGKPIPFVVKPFTPSSYDDQDGIVGAPNSVDISAVAPGMVLVNPATGEGYEIISLGPDNTILIQPNLNITASKLAVVPKYQIYKVRREHTFFRETYTIGCHAHGDPAVLLWLHAIVLYSLLRYREGLLEARGFAQSIVSSSDLIPNPDMSVGGGESVFSRYITLTGQVENSWLKSPKRVIESARLYNTPSKTKGYSGGIKIISQQAPDFLDDENEPWETVDE